MGLNPWIRLYREALHDPKLVTLPDRQFRAWVNCLLIADDSGVLPSRRDVAVHMRVSIVDVDNLLCDLVEAGLLDADAMSGNVTTYRLHGWKQRQYASDTSAERMAKYRAKRKASGLPTVSDYSKFKPDLVKRDGCACVYCLVDDKKLVVDHMVPISQGGTDHSDNLALACKECNSGKSGRTPDQAGMKIRVLSASSALLRYLNNGDRNSDGIESESDTDTDTESPGLPSSLEAAREQKKNDQGILNKFGGRRQDGRQEKLLRRAEGLGVPVDDLTARLNQHNPKNRSAYFTTLCVEWLRKRLPGIEEQVIRDALWGTDAQLAIVMNLMVQA